MVIALAEHQLLIGAANSGADGGRLAKIENRAVDWADLAESDLLPVRRQERIRRNRNLVSEDIAGRNTGQTEIGMSAEAHGGGLSGYRLQ